MRLTLSYYISLSFSPPTSQLARLSPAESSATARRGASRHVLKIDTKCDEREKRPSIFLMAKNFPVAREESAEEESEAEESRHGILHETERQRNPHRRLLLMEHVKTANNNGRFPLKEIARVGIEREREKRKLTGIVC